MPQDIAQIRQIQGRFQHDLARPFPPAALRSPPAGGAPLHIRNARDCAVALLLLSAALRPAPSSSPKRAGFIAGVQAAPDASHPLIAPSLASRTLGSVANSVVTTCVAAPRRCPQAVAAGTLAALGVVTAGTLGYVAGRAGAPSCAPADAPHATAPRSAQSLLQALPAEARQQVWEILQHCNGALDCAIPEIRAVLEQLPPPLQQQLMGQVMAPAADNARPAAWMPGAEAAVFPPGVNWMDHLATLLGTQITAEEAAFELDLAAIVDATLASQDQPGSIVKRRQAANEARLDAIAERFERSGYAVEQRPFDLVTHTLFGFPYRTQGRNLLVTLGGTGEAVRTLMLVAHGDMVAAEAGSTGAVDNGAGVAALLAVARRLTAAGLPRGIRVQLLITDKEEMSLHGAKAHVVQCQAADDCADMTLVADLLAQGDGISLSGSNEHGRYRDGDSRPRGQDIAQVSAGEAHMTHLLRGAAAAVGLQVHETTNWTLPSDHIAFQREGLDSIGLSLMDAADVAPERARQLAREAYRQAEEAVDWSQYEAYLGNTLNSTQDAEMARMIGTAEAASAAFEALPLSGRQRLIHSGADQPERVDARRALAAVNVIHRAVTAWLAAPAPAER